MIENRFTEIQRLTDGPKHHLFGFHDLIIDNQSGSKYLAIEAEIINRPPLPGELFGVGYVENGKFIKIGETTALNYPQGSRQQWVGDTNLFTVNNRVGDEWGTDLYDATLNKLIDRYSATTHMLTRDGRYALGLDYARLHRLGGYGYTGIPDKGASDPFPKESGITITDLKTKETKVLVSVREVAECGTSNLSGKTHHYITHLCLNPSSNRVAFLHRYFMPDGGQMTRLMTVGIDGSNLRCLGQGFLSHFDWKDDTSIYIYGRAGSAVDTIRNNPMLQNGVAKQFIRFAKNYIKKFRKGKKSIVPPNAFLMISDNDKPVINKFALSTIPGDGHPMTNPMNRSWCVCDTYPNSQGDRDLFLYNFEKDLRLNLGKFRRIFDNPDLTESELFTLGMDCGILNTISLSQVAFTRSGLHCDLHPRWSHDGRWVLFDSIHEGSRQIYRVNVNDIISEKGK